MEISWWAELLDLNELATPDSLFAAVFVDKLTNQGLKSLTNSSCEPPQETGEAQGQVH